MSRFSQAHSSIRITALRVLFVYQLVLFGLPPTVHAQFAWTANNGSVTITRYVGSGGPLTIPATIDGLPDTCIGDEAFARCSNLTSVAIPSGVTNIAYATFAFCTNLASVTLPNSITTIGDWAFGDCARLPGITLPDSLTSLGRGVFYRCGSLTNVILPNSLTSMGIEIFGECPSLLSVTIGNSVTNCGERAFYSCSNLTEVTIGTSVSSIGTEAFSGCTKLASIALPASVTHIGAFAFLGCTNLTTVTLPGTMDSIEQFAFLECEAVAGVYVEGNAPDVGGDVFGDSPAAIVYYQAGTSGWESMFGGRPTALWIPPPVYTDWLPSTALPTQYPQASAEADDPDQDGINNRAEMLAGTDPTDPRSVLTLERVPRPNDLAEEDKTAIAETEHAVYFRSVPGKSYGVQWAASPSGPWMTLSVVTATTTQKRLVLFKPMDQAFYRMMLAQ